MARLRNILKGKRFSMPKIDVSNAKKSSTSTKSKIHRSFTTNDIRHPLIKKTIQNNLASNFRKMKKAHSSKAITDKALEAHIKKYKIKKKTFSEMKELLKNFDLFYKELKKLVANVMI